MFWVVLPAIWGLDPLSCHTWSHSEGYLLRRDEKMADKDDQDGLKLMCKQHHGQKGPIFDQWALIYLDCCEAKGDEDGSWGLGEMHPV